MNVLTVNREPDTGYVSLDVPKLQRWLWTTRTAHVSGRACLELLIHITNHILQTARPQGSPNKVGLTILGGSDGGGLNVSVIDLHAIAQDQLARGQADHMTTEQMATAIITAIGLPADKFCEDFGISFEKHDCR